jgi:hypothetical protein
LRGEDGFESPRQGNPEGRAARALRRARVDELTIMARGGWKTRAMFARYSITDERDQAEAQAKLDAALAAPGARRVVPLTRRRQR